MKKIYIAGKVTGEPIAEVAMKFGAAQKELEAMGFEVVNPIAVVNDFNCPWDIAMRKCIAALMQCDYIFLLPDHRQSKGATLELDLAKMVGIKAITKFAGKICEEMTDKDAQSVYRDPYANHSIAHKMDNHPW